MELLKSKNDNNNVRIYVNKNDYNNLEYNKVPIKNAIIKYKQDNNDVSVYQMPSNNWIINYIKERSIFGCIKEKNKWFCNQNALEKFNFKGQYWNR